MGHALATPRPDPGPVRTGPTEEHARHDRHAHPRRRRATAGRGSPDPMLDRMPDELAADLRREMAARGSTRPWRWAAGGPGGRPARRRRHTPARVPGARPARRSAWPTRPAPTPSTSAAPRRSLSTGQVRALKAYLGYLHYGPDSPATSPTTSWRPTYGIPVIFHTGDTYSPRAKLRYAHPLLVDEVAVDHPSVRFVLAHFGNPWLDRRGRGHLQERQRLGRPLRPARRRRRPTSATGPRTWCVCEDRRRACAGPSATPSGRTASSTAATGRWRRWPRTGSSSSRSSPPRIGDLSWKGTPARFFKLG